MNYLVHNKSVRIPRDRKVWFISDTHFSHPNVVRYSNRPFADAREMDDTIVAGWRERVAPDDLVYHLGDFSFGKSERTKEIMAQLTGQIHLVLGNHDTSLKPKVLELFASVQNYVELFFPWANERVVLQHYPIERWNRRHHGAWHLHGHSHGTRPAIPGRLDVGVDGHGSRLAPHFHPILWDDVLVELKKDPAAQGRSSEELE